LTKTSVLRAILDVFFVMGRARAAAQLYAELSRKCDRELARKGASAPTSHALPMMS
jgi:hypothetical protein